MGSFVGFVSHVMSHVPHMTETWLMTLPTNTLIKNGLIGWFVGHVMSHVSHMIEEGRVVRHAMRPPPLMRCMTHHGGVSHVTHELGYYDTRTRYHVTHDSLLLYQESDVYLYMCQCVCDTWLITMWNMNDCHVVSHVSTGSWVMCTYMCVGVYVTHDWSHGWSGEGLKLEVETYYLKRVYSVSSDFSRSRCECPI